MKLAECGRRWRQIKAGCPQQVRHGISQVGKPLDRYEEITGSGGLVVSFETGHD